MADASATCVSSSSHTSAPKHDSVESQEWFVAAMAEQYRPVALAYALAVLRHQEEAEDAVEEAILRAIQAAHRYRSEQAWAPWFLSIVRNICRDCLRRRNKRATVSLDQDQLDPSPSPELVVLVGERSAMLAAAVAALPEDRRVPLVMHYTLGLTLDQTALALGLRRSTVVGRIASALRILRRALKEAPE